MAYQHGINVKENATSLARPIKAASGLQVVVGTAPVHLTQDPYSKANTPVKVENFEEAVKYLGYSNDFKHYTLCQSMDASFKIFSVTPVIFINVLDPNNRKHTKDNPEQSYAVENGQATVNIEGVLLDSLVVKKEETELENGVDYIAEFNRRGYVLISLLDRDDKTAELFVSSTSLNPEAVTEDDIIGGYDAQTGKEKGIQAVRQVYPKYNMVPRLLLAPGWSQMKDVGAALDSKNVINEVFTCENILDLDTAEAAIYTDVEELKKANGYTSPHSIVCWPKLSVNGQQYAFSAILGALIAHTDTLNNDVPSMSMSNKLLGITGTVLADGTEVTLDQPTANTLNAVGVVTAINDEGFRAWGNNMACYPNVTDPKDRWICCRRFFSWWGNTFIQTYKRKVDSPANYRLIESIIDSENIRGNSLVSQGKCAGAKMEYRADENPIEEILEGNIRFRQYLAPYTPAEHILNVLEFDPSMLEAELAGGEA